MEGGGNENKETRKVEGRTTEQNHMDLLLIYLFFVYTYMYLGPSAHTICVGIQYNIF